MGRRTHAGGSCQTLHPVIEAVVFHIDVMIRSAVDAGEKLELDYNTWIPAHPPNPDRPLSKTDVRAAVKTSTN